MNAAGSRAAFLDRDGVLVDELGYLARAADLALLPGAAAAVARLNAARIPVVVVTNQSGIARGLFDERDLEEVHARLARELERSGAHLDLVLHCPHHPEHGERVRCACRKPEPGLFLKAAARLALDLRACSAIGDSARDLEAARRAGVAQRILVATGKGRATRAGLTPLEQEGLAFARDLPEAVELVLRRPSGAP